MKNFKRTLASVLTLVMALTMFAGTVSAEDTATEDTTTEEAVDTSYTWTLYKDYVAPTSVTTTADPVVTTVDSAEAPTAGTTYSQVTVNNNDGTATHTLTKTVIAVVDNGDGTTEVTTTVTDTVTVYDLMQENNPAIDLKIYSSRVNAIGFLNCNTFEANRVASVTSGHTYKDSTGGIQNNDGYRINPDNVEYDNDRYNAVVDDKTNEPASYYIGAKNAASRELLMYLARPYNDMWVEFTAPADGLYSAQGYISQHVITTGDDYTYNFVKIDLNGNIIDITSEVIIPLWSGTDDKRLGSVKVELKKGEKLALTTFGTAGVTKIFLDSYAVTKLDYSEADDKSTVTTNYSYKNYNYEKIYGDTFATSLSKNYENVWDMNAVRYSLDDTLEANKKLVLNAVKSFEGYADGKLYNTDKNWCTDLTSKYAPYIVYDSSTDILKAHLPTRNAGDGNLYNYGFQFIFTVPENGNAVITSPQFLESNNMTIRYGIKKADGETVEYYGPKSSAGIAQMWYAFGASNTTRTFTVNDLKAGDKIYIEITSDNVAINYGRICSLDTLNIALTTENSPADVTGDFKADATDTIFMRKHLLRKLTGKVEDLDITGDNLADLRDLVMLKKKIAGIE